MIKWIKNKFKKQREKKESLSLNEKQRRNAINAIRDTEGFKVIIEDFETLADEVRDVAVLATNYGSKRIDKQLGTLGGAGLIASNVIYTQLELYDEKSNEQN